MTKQNFDFLIVGAGFSGSVCARQLAEANKKVLIIDKRNHIGGNAYDQVDAHGILIHPYGPHIFHTNSKKYLNIYPNLPIGGSMSIAFSPRLNSNFFQFRLTGQPSISFTQKIWMRLELRSS